MGSRGSVNARFITRYGMTRLDLRQMLYRRQNGLCPLCREPLPKGYVASRHVNLDHRTPRAHGGPDIIENLDLVHLPCNQEKGESCVGCPECEPEEVDGC